MKLLIPHFFINWVFKDVASIKLDICSMLVRLSGRQIRCPSNVSRSRRQIWRYKSVKSSNPSVILSEFLTVPRLGALYETDLCFNRNYPVHNIISNSNSVLYLSATWNNFLFETVLDTRPFGELIKNQKLKTDLAKLCYIKI